MKIYSQNWSRSSASRGRDSALRRNLCGLARDLPWYRRLRRMAAPARSALCGQKGTDLISAAWQKEGGGAIPTILQNLRHDYSEERARKEGDIRPDSYRKRGGCREKATGSAEPAKNDVFGRRSCETALSQLDRADIWQRVTEQEKLPNVFSSAANVTAAMSMGGRLALPLGTERELHDVRLPLL